MIEPRRLVLLGHPVSHSLSPAIQNAALDAAGISLRYEAVDVHPRDLTSTLAELARSAAGGNLTIPHKTDAIPSMASLTPVAREVGAVNTFRPDGAGGLQGHNTDVDGFESLLKRAIGEPRRGLDVTVLGAGGAASAVLTVLRRWGCRGRIIARNTERAHAIVERFSDVASVAQSSTSGRIEGDVVVNATPIGLADDSFPVSLDRIREGTVVVDLVYKRGETAWVRAARERGFTAVDGITMLVEQAAAAFSYWFGRSPDRDAMLRAIATTTSKVTDPSSRKHS